MKNKIKMRIILIGLGCGTENITRESLDALKNADIIIGSARVLKEIEEIEKDIKITPERYAAIYPEKILEILKILNLSRDDNKNICIVYGGDTGFHSGAGSLIKLLEREKRENKEDNKDNKKDFEIDCKIDCKVLPGISTAQVLSARLGRSWQDWNFISAHGVECDIIQAVLTGRPAFLLTDKINSPDRLCRELARVGLDDLNMIIAENLGQSDEKIYFMTAGEAAETKFADLSVMLMEAAPEPVRISGILDKDFIRVSDSGIKIPITKQEVRAVIVSKLAVKSQDIIWDIGAGTGSVGIEMATRARRVYAIERRPEALNCIEKNREKFHAWNLNIIPGQAPEILKILPAPDAVLIGGSGGYLRDILEYIIKFIIHKKPDLRICISAITIETVMESLEFLKILEESGFETEVTQISASHSRVTPSGSHMMLAANPVYIILSRRV